MTTVLVVEDDLVFRGSLARDLGSRGIDVAVASDVDEGLALMQRRSFEVLLTDLRLGGRDGIDLLKRARAVAPATRAILMSGFATARDYQRAIELGAVRVLCKPFTSEELLQSIELARDCTRGYSGSVHGLSLIDVLQLYHLGRRTVALTVVGDRGGRVFLRDGDFVHAECGPLVGEPALISLLARPDGVLRTDTLPPFSTDTIERPAQLVLLDCLRRLDEGHGDDGASTVAEMPDARERARVRLHGEWHRISREVPVPHGTIDVVGVDLGSHAGVQIVGIGDPESWIEPLGRLVEVLSRLSDSRRGVVQMALENVQVAAVWELDRQSAFLLTDVGTSATANAWFRAFTAAVARGVLSETNLQ